MRIITSLRASRQRRNRTRLPPDLTIRTSRSERPGYVHRARSRRSALVSPLGRLPTRDRHSTSHRRFVVLAFTREDPLRERAVHRCEAIVTLRQASWPQPVQCRLVRGIEQLDEFLQEGGKSASPDSFPNAHPAQARHSVR